MAVTEPPFNDDGRADTDPGAPNAEPTSREHKAGRGARAKRREAAGAEGKRERILRAAIKVFARKGFYSTRVSEIAKAAGVADGTIYLYFKNKDDVLISIFQDHTTKLIALMSGRHRASSPASRPSCACAWTSRLGLLDGSRELAEVVTVNLRQSSRLLEAVRSAHVWSLSRHPGGRVRGGAGAGQPCGADLSPRVLARALWGSLDAITLGWALGGGDEPAMKRSAQQVATHVPGRCASRKPHHSERLVRTPSHRPSILHPRVAEFSSSSPMENRE